jgi:hypothetical protein
LRKQIPKAVEYGVKSTGELGRLVIVLNVSVATASPMVWNSLRQREFRASDTSPMLEGLRVRIGTPGSTDSVEDELRAAFFIVLNIKDVIIAKLTNGLPQRRDRFAAGSHYCA